MVADSTSDLAIRIARIEDRQQIADLVSTYARTVDARDGEGFGRLWAPDATYEVGEPVVVNAGPAKIVAAIERTFAAFRSTDHLTSNLVVELGPGNRASAICDVVAHVVYADGTPDVIAASYHDDFVREGGSWLFSRRVVVGRSVAGDLRAPDPDWRDQIRELCYRYTGALDRGDFAAVAELLAYADLRPSMPGVVGEPIRGAEAIERFYTDQVVTYRDGDPRTRHLITNQVIEFGSDGRTAESHCYVTVLQRAPGHDYQLVVGGRYHDRFERVGGQWRFVEKAIQVDHLNQIELHFKIADALRR